MLDKVTQKELAEAITTADRHRILPMCRKHSKVNKTETWMESITCVVIWQWASGLNVGGFLWPPMVVKGSAGF
jgi:hypothetical protein